MKVLPISNEPGLLVRNANRLDVITTFEVTTGSTSVLIDTLTKLRALLQRRRSDLDAIGAVLT
jgi:hypothetical protein